MFSGIWFETLVFECEKAKRQFEIQLIEKLIQEKEELWNEVRCETEQNIREFYLSEIDRKEPGSKAKDEYKQQLEQLQDNLKRLLFQKQDKEPIPKYINPCFFPKEIPLIPEDSPNRAVVNYHYPFWDYEIIFL